MGENVKPRLKTTDETFGLMGVKSEIVNWIELEPTLQLMKEMGEALKENGLSHDFDCGITVNGRHECSCGYLKSKEVLEKYRKFLEGIK